MERWCNKVAIVTGATRGIGKAIAIKLAQNNIKTVAIGRSFNSNEEFELLHPNIIFRYCDITDENNLKALLIQIFEDIGDVHILINNAGLANFGLMSEQNSETWRKLMDTNVMALCVASQIVITHMREKKIKGQIININSVSGHYIPCFDKPIMGIYPASKFAVTAVTETLRQEMTYLGTEIKVTSLSPGYVYTDIHKDGGDTTNPNGMNPEDVADGVEYILSTKPSILVKELTLKAIGERF